MTVLFVIATIIIFLSIDGLVRKFKRQPSLAKQATQTSFPIRLPAGIFFAPSHTWINLYPSGQIRLGVDDFVSSLVDSPEIAFLKKTNEHVTKGDPILQLTNGGHSLTIHSPLAGEVVAVNDELLHNPSLLKEKLFSDGWGYIMKPERIDEVKHMFLGDETRLWIRDEFQRLRDFFASRITNGTLQPAYLQDGGLPAAGILNTMDDEVWHQLNQEFFQVQ